MKKFLLTLLTCVLVFGLQAATVTEGFEDVTIVDADGNPLASSWALGSGLSNGWKVVDGNIVSSAGSSNYGLWTKAHTGKKSLEASYSATNNAFVVIPSKLMGEFKFWARKTSSSSSTKGTLKIFEVSEANGSYTKSGELATYNLTTTWKEYNLDLGTSGKLIAINMVRAGIDDVEYTTFETVTTPQIAVSMDGSTIKSGYTHDFGLVKGAASSYFTLANTGAGTLNATLTATEGYTLSASAVALEAGKDTTITVTQAADSTGLKSGTITISAPDADSLIIKLQGIVRDSSKIYVNFDSFPEGWTLNDDSYATVEDGYLKANYLYAAELTSPRITVSDGEQMYFRYRRGTTSSYQTSEVNLFYSENATDWTQIGDNIAADATDAAWHSALVSGVPATAKYIKISAKYVDIDDIYGFSLPKEAIMKASVEDFDFGMIDKDSTQTFLIENIGASVLTGIKATVNDSTFTVSVPENIEVNSGDYLKVTMNAAVKGLHTAVVELTANEQDTVRFNVTGYIIDKDAMLIDFATDSLPQGWENKGWSVNESKAYAGYGGSNPPTLTSPQLVISDDDELAIRASKEYESGKISLYASRDGGQSWALVHDFTSELKTETMSTIVVYGLEPGKAMLRFEGSYANIETINGLHVDDNAPRMQLTYNDNAVNDSDSISFGITKEPITRTFNISNIGTGTLNVRITVADSTQFTVSDTILAVTKNEAKTFSVTMPVGEPFGKKATVLTVQPTDEGLKAINIKLSGETRDSTLWSEDFESGISELWTNNGWITENPYYGNGSQMAYSTSSDSTYIITPRLRAKQGDKLIYQAMLPWAGETLKVEYSTDEKQTWTVDSTYSFNDNYTLKDMEFTAPDDGTYFIRFSGRYCYIDNFYGFRYEPEVPTGINSVSVRTQNDGNVYDLSGRRVNESNVVRGIYIKNGKKFIRK